MPIGNGSLSSLAQMVMGLNLSVLDTEVDSSNGHDSVQQLDVFLPHVAPTTIENRRPANFRL